MSPGSWQASSTTGLLPTTRTRTAALRPYLIREPGAVTSVNGETGAVVLSAADVGAAPIAHTHLAVEITDLASRLHYSHVQAVPSTVWDVTHNLGRYPSVSVADSTNRKVFGGVQYLSVNTLRLSFSGAFSGTAYLN